MKPLKAFDEEWGDQSWTLKDQAGNSTGKNKKQEILGNQLLQSTPGKSTENLN